MEVSHLWGIDLGGSKIEGIVVEKKSPKNIISRHRIATEGEKGYQHVLHRIQALLLQLSEQTGLAPTSLGIGSPGTLDKETNQLRGSNSQHLNGKPLIDDLQSLLGIPIRIENDANCFALAETKLGIISEVFPDANIIFGVILGTGVGGGLIVNGQVINGPHGISGEWGHNFLDHSGGDCYCGKIGCVETILSGPGIERFYTQLSGERKSLESIVILSHNGNSHAIQTVERLHHFFGKAIASLINIIDPDVIVIGGGVGNIDSLYSHGVQEISPYLFAPKLRTRILKPSLGDSAGVFGAALLTQES